MYMTFDLCGQLEERVIQLSTIDQGHINQWKWYFREPIL